MEPATFAVAVATLLFSEALKEGGKKLGQGVSDLAAKLIKTVRGKFKESGTEGVLTRVQQLKAAGMVRQVMASGLEVETLEAGAMTQMAASGADVEQHMLTDVTAKNIKLGDMKQET